MKILTIIKKRGSILVLLFLFFAAPINVTARLVPCGSGTGIACEMCHLFEMIGIIFNFIVWRIVPSIAVIMFMVAGLIFFTALGDPSKVKQAKQIFISTIGGFLIIVLAWSIVLALYTAMGAGTPIGWWEIPGCPLPR